jgi:hypothetical protein
MGLRSLFENAQVPLRFERLGTAMAHATLTPPSTVRYVGVADWWGFHVWIEEEDGARRALPYRGEARLASFAWGRNGLAARELARALIEDATGSPALAERHCRELTHAVIAELPELGFELTCADVLAWLEAEPEAA